MLQKPLGLFTLLAGMAIASSAWAQTWPTKPIRLLTPFSPGGGSDVLARHMAPALGEALGQQVIVENKAGAGGNIGTDYVAKSAPDGYTFLITTNAIVINPGAQKVPYDTVKDFAPVGMVASNAVVLAIHPSVPATNVREFIAYVRANPGKVAYGDCGPGSVMHLAGELMKTIAKIDMVHVPYKGCAPAITDALGGQIPVIFNTYTNTVQHHRGGKLRILGTTAATRSPIDSSIPPIAEAGLAGLDADIWFAVFGPAGVPREIIQRLNGEIRATLAKPDVREKLRAQYFEVRAGTPEQLAQTVRDDLARWSKVIKEANIRID
jgi:tripartite-type tricarboxylate transporter receptor subunit TctC